MKIGIVFEVYIEGGGGGIERRSDPPPG